jgi:hypothetical protein
MVWNLVRPLVHGQHALAQMRCAAAVNDSWTGLGVSKLIGTQRDCPPRLRNFTVAIGAFDTVGPGLTGVQDATEAIWSNKHHVWVQELGG